MEVCPITSAYLATLRKLIDFNSPLYEWYAHQLGEVEELVATQLVSKAVQHQRAFLCLEYATIAVAGYPGLFELGSKPPAWTKSREGLNALLVWLRTAVDDLTCSRMEYSILASMANSSVSGTTDMQHTRADKLSAVYALAIESAVVARRGLKNPQARLRRIGRNMGYTMCCASRPVLEMLQFAEELMGQQEQYVERIWRKK